MYVDIRARDNSDCTYDRTKPGKSMWVNDSDFKITLRKMPATHLGNPAWYLELSGDVIEEKVVTDDRYSAIWRELTMQLTPADLNRIFLFAIEHDLIRVVDR